MSATLEWVAKEQALRAHDQALEEHGGAGGVRDEGLLESALARAENFHAYGETDLCLLAAAYAVGIARNHPFVDGNKRTAYAVASLFLYLNGYELKTTSEEEHIALFEDVAVGLVSQEERAECYRARLQARAAPGAGLALRGNGAQGAARGLQRARDVGLGVD